MIDVNDTLFLLNPKAKHDTAEKTWGKLYKKYPQLSERPFDITTINLAETIHTRKPKLIVVAGGDGAINAVCNIVSHMSTKPLITIIPLGTGNAISYCLGVETLDKAM